MAKSRKHMHKKRNGKRARRVMKGGDFTQEQKTILQNTGFYPGQIDRFELMGITFEQVNQKLQEIMGENFHGNSDDLVEAVEQALDEEHMNQGVQNQDIHNNDNMDINNDGPMQLNELDVDSDYAATDSEDNSDDEMDGGKKRRRTLKKRKGRKTMKKRKGRKTMKKRKGRKTRKQRGGTCYGNGVGANNYDPSFSIYNTRELTLFPYKPTN